MAPAPAGEVVTVEALPAPFDATVALPGSKSITNRALICAGLAAGESTLDGALFADDTLAMVGCLRGLGIGVELDEAGARMTVSSPGLPAAAPASLFANQSGTTGRFILPVAALGATPVRVDGDAQLRRRPFAPLLDALVRLGVSVAAEGEPGHLPVVVTGPLRGGAVSVPGDLSSQFLSALLLAGPAMPEGIEIALSSPLVSASYVAMTAAVMTSFGAAALERRPGAGGALEVLKVPPGGYRPTRYRVEPDASAASYFFAAAAITKSRVVVEGLGRASLQGDVAFAGLLEQMGAEVVRSPEQIAVRGTGVLHGIDADLSDCSDTAPTLAVVAAFADSPSTLRGIGFIRHKESDRIGRPVTELRRAGIAAEELEDGMRIVPGAPVRTRLRTYDDHRLAMSLALLGLGGSGMEIENPGCVAKTFPDYFERLAELSSPR
ncbi:MAG: 3-phosphoshikimate 1-carboxyvinyltransferase [Actinomycetota bacterium]|nr:3-phosphoshikimate 1-carboxyvinyltransferase [Actinomycetota bacterium]